MACHWAEQIASGELQPRTVSVTDVTDPSQTAHDEDTSLGAKDAAYPGVVDGA